jgi:hypothetical protein
MGRQLTEEDLVTESMHTRSWPVLHVPLGRQLRKRREKDLRPNDIRAVKVKYCLIYLNKKRAWRPGASHVNMESKRRCKREFVRQGKASRGPRDQG